MTIKTQVDEHGIVRHYQDGKLHRVGGPAAEYRNGAKLWCRNGQLHRIDGPAVERANGDRHWYQKSRLHRIDGPAVERANGTKQWYQNGKLLDVFYANGGCCSPTSRQEAIERLNSKPRPYSYDMYLAWVNERFPL